MVQPLPAPSPALPILQYVCPPRCIVHSCAMYSQTMNPSLSLPPLPRCPPPLQPSTEIFEAFDMLILMQLGGRLSYFGRLGACGVGKSAGKGVVALEQRAGRDRWDEGCCLQGATERQWHISGITHGQCFCPALPRTPPRVWARFQVTSPGLTARLPFWPCCLPPSSHARL